ncbi:uncharacterized protein LOC129288174 [Prosopis cineraria]|uniref:uncharacterized protein LOC129288174 n=1 Tax=Prosopis cineraria TaxID=364024 RepID=UPI00240FE7E3|nr:uncharacterized protein LOC129288174 [Prosopis cineraria]
MRQQVVKLFKELREILDKFSTLLMALLAAWNTTDTGAKANPSFKSQHDKLKICLVLIIVLYYLMLVIGTILVRPPPHSTRLLPILTSIAVLLVSSASVLGLAVI